MTRHQPAAGVGMGVAAAAVGMGAATEGDGVPANIHQTLRQGALPVRSLGVWQICGL